MMVRALDDRRMTRAGNDFLLALRSGDRIDVRSDGVGGRHFVVIARDGIPVDMASRGWVRRRRHVSMIDTLVKDGVLRPAGRDDRTMRYKVSAIELRIARANETRRRWLLTHQRSYVP